MASHRADLGQANREREAEWARSDRVSSRVAMAIALMPIPLAALIAWVLGTPIGRSRPEAPPHAPAGVEGPAHPGPVPHRGGLAP